MQNNRLRPRLHFTPQRGWINDPNGFVFYRGKYHLFFQYNPYACHWASMHWGHAVSDDLLHWTQLPLALQPDTWYDADPQGDGGCFSGSAIVCGQRLYLLYTGSVHIGGVLHQSQNLAWTDDGIHFTKYPGNPVIPAPPDGGAADFRDPKVFAHNGFYYLVVGGAGAANTGGRVYLYKSDDLITWHYRGVLFSSTELGTVFECPDLFFLDGKWVLTFSPIGNASGIGAIYLTGTLDLNACTFVPQATGRLDWGPDYYAPQSCTDGSGRRWITAWQGTWPWMQGYAGTAPTGAEGWCGTLTIPRLVSCAADGTLRFAPPYNAFPSTVQSDGPTAITAQKQALPFTHCLCWALTIEVRWTAIDAKCLELELLACADGCIRLHAVPASRTVCLTRYDAAGTAQKVGQVVCTNGEKDCLSLHIIVDHSSVDTFLNDGSAVLTTNFYPIHGRVCSSLRAIGGTATLETCHQCALA